MVNVQPIAETIVGFRKSVLLFTAVHLGIFGFIRNRTWNARSIAVGMGLNVRAMEIMLDALVSTGFLIKKGHRYSNAPISLVFLDPQSPTSLSNNLNYQFRLMESWMDLPRILSVGKPRAGLVRRLMDPRFVKDYIQGLRELARGSADQVAVHLAPFGGTSALDVGGGHGSYLLSLLERNPKMAGTLMDLPKTVRLARRFFKDVSDRVHFQTGDYRRNSLGDNAYDLVLMSHVTHDESESTNRSLFKKAYRALTPGGVLAVHDFIVNDARTSSLFSALFSVHMLTYTTNGRVYSLSEYKNFLRSAGFVVQPPVPINAGAANESCLLIAQKRRERK